MIGSRLVCCLGWLAISVAAAAAPTQTMLLSFAGGTAPAYPNGRLLQGANGVLYGVSSSGGGTANAGTVFMLTPPSASQPGWLTTVLYAFQNGADGERPVGGLIGDANGVLYGVTASGGAGSDGTIFSLTPPATSGGSWTETTLHAFKGGTDGEFPSEDAGLIMDNAGALYGTTINGGAGNGTVFRLAPPVAGTTTWTETILHTFKGGNDGYFPEAGLFAGTDGSLYGTTSGGGHTFSCNGNACGTLFRLVPPASGSAKWTHAVLHSFTKAAGSNPEASLVSDPDGNLYGTASEGGGASACSLGCGAVFRLSAPAAGASRWTQQTLHAFASGADSEFPMSVLVRGNDGTLWGAAYGATPNRLGATFYLTPPAAGGKKWIETIVHTFAGGADDGATPSAGLTLGAGGVLYGVTSEGGNGGRGICGDGCGTMFEITP